MHGTCVSLHVMYGLTTRSAVVMKTIARGELAARSVEGRELTSLVCGGERTSYIVCRGRELASLSVEVGNGSLVCRGEISGIVYRGGRTGCRSRRCIVDGCGMAEHTNRWTETTHAIDCRQVIINMLFQLST